ncbi:hypothetical protein IWW45_008890 [Coemansia sp. RSA 485]|nr:hypothetical protein IWW45_008890 [Coemansia sp. RSA 485]
MAPVQALSTPSVGFCSMLYNCAGPLVFVGGCAALALSGTVALLIKRRRTRDGMDEQQQQQNVAAQRQRSSGLGIGRPLTTNKRTRRYHSIAILTETTPLVMEQGEEFFAPPKTPARRGRKHPRDNNNVARETSNATDTGRRRNFTAPSAGRRTGLHVLRTLVEENSEDAATRTSSSGSTVCSRGTLSKTVAELAHEWDQRQQQQTTTN